MKRKIMLSVVALLLSTLAIAPKLATAQECIDTVPFGNGWGWNGFQSCRTVAVANTCIDTPPAGDGWGWDGSTSCRLEATTNECIDSPPIGDGWGWNGVESCTINDSAATTTCFDTPPFGNGWGWNGNSSCRLSIDEPVVLPPVPENQSPLKIMPTGDSITHGTLGQRSYRSALTNMLSAGGDGGCDFEMVGSQTNNEDPTDFRSAHEGYSHHRAQHFLTGFSNDAGDNAGILDSMNRFNPDVVLLHIGSNDIAQGESQSSTINEIEDIISIVFSVNPNAHVFVANVIPWYGRTSRNNDVTDDIRELGEDISALVVSLNNPNITFVDVQDGYTQDMMLADLVHPNDDGELHIARAFDDAIDASGVCLR